METKFHPKTVVRAIRTFADIQALESLDQHWKFVQTSLCMQRALWALHDSSMPLIAADVARHISARMNYEWDTTGASKFFREHFKNCNCGGSPYVGESPYFIRRDVTSYGRTVYSYALTELGTQLAKRLTDNV